jgi:hypothetical protein
MKRIVTTLTLALLFSSASVMADGYGTATVNMIKQAIAKPVSPNDRKTQAQMAGRSYGVSEARDYYDDDYEIDSLTMAREAAVEVAAEAVSVPAAVGIASVTGTTASTGTAIASLSGAAATSATLAAIGSSTVGTALGAAATVVGITAAPAVIGGAIVVGIATGVACGVNAVIDWW